MVFQLKDSAKRVQNYLVNKGFSFEVQELSDSTRTAQESIPIQKSYCGSCTACVDLCPGSAPNGKNWKSGLYRDNFFDA